MHTKMSSDSKMKIEDAIEKSNNLNIGLVLTEHLDLDFKYSKTAFRVNLDAYFKEYEKYKSSKLLLGVEIGIASNKTDEYKKIAENYPIDFILGSMHKVGDMEIDRDLLNGDISEKEAYNKFLTCACKIIDEYDFIDSFGHIDYISRYTKNEMMYKDYPELFDKLLSKLIDKKICLEVNTKRLNQSIAYETVESIYKRYVQLGGKYVTIGSDAHDEKEIGRYFDIATNLIKEHGLEIVYFKERKMIKCSW
jgi:histidinol-phosphatase (PHP family)